MKKIILCGLLISSGFAVLADPPKAPAGKVWVLNPEMSDEFGPDGPDPDVFNLYTRERSWDRTAAFDPKAIEIENDTSAEGNHFLTMNPLWYYEDEVFTKENTGRTYYFAGGAMDTRNLQTYGYFEVRIRPSDFPFGSGVFMNSRGNPTTICEDKYSTELDLIENMGYTGPGAGEYDSRGGFFNYVQHVNSHTKDIKYVDSAGNCVSYSGWDGWESRGADTYELDDPHAFFTVGMWWEDSTRVHFYNNDRYFSSLEPARKFKIPMALILSMETYTTRGSDENNAGNPKPAEWMWDEEFRTKDQRAVKYDWVRTWRLIDVDSTILNDTTDHLLAEHDTIKTYPGQKISSTLIFSAKDDRTVIARFLSPSGEVLDSTLYAVNKGVHSLIFDLTIDEALPEADSYKIKYQMLNGSMVVDSATTPLNLAGRIYKKKLWGDLIPESLEPGDSSYTIQIRYETDTASTINMEFKNPDNSGNGFAKVNVEAGRGVVPISFATTTPPEVAPNYYFKVYMYRRGMNWRDPLAVDVSPIYVDVEEPGGSSSIKINNISSPIFRSNTSIDVEFTYDTECDGSLRIELIDSLNQTVAEEKRAERSGSRTITRPMKIDSMLIPGDDYRLAILYHPDDTSLPDLTDTLYNVIIRDIADSLSLITAPDTLQENTASMQVLLAYYTLEERDLTVKLLDKEGGEIVFKTTTVTGASDNFDLSMPLPSLSPSDSNFLVAILNEIGSSTILVSDTIRGIFIEAEDVVDRAGSHSINQEVTSYPNPTTGEINIILPSIPKRIKNIMLLDINGKQLDVPNIYSGPNSIKLDLSSCQEGIYLIRIITASNTYMIRVVR